MEDFDIEGWVSKDVQSQAKNLGLTIHIRNSDSELNPLRHSDLIIVGGGGHDAISTVANFNIEKSMHGNKIEDAVRNYAKQYDVDQNDMLWWTIHTHRHGGITLDTQLIKDTYVFEVGIGGFIYMSKKMVREEYGVKRISSAIKDKVEAQMKASLRELADWINGDVYSISIYDADDDLVDGLDGVIADDDGTLDSSVIDMLAVIAGKSHKALA